MNLKRQKHSSLYLALPSPMWIDVTALTSDSWKHPYLLMAGPHDAFLKKLSKTKVCSQYSLLMAKFRASYSITCITLDSMFNIWPSLRQQKNCQVLNALLSNIWCTGHISQTHFIQRSIKGKKLFCILSIFISLTITSVKTCMLNQTLLHLHSHTYAILPPQKSQHTLDKFSITCASHTAP